MRFRGGKPLVYGDPFQTGGGGPPRTFIDLSSWGTFSRASEGSCLIGAATDGTTNFIRWASNDVRRFEDRGDGNGKMLLLEGSRKNWVYTSPKPNAGNWKAGPAPLNSVNSYKAPDATYRASYGTSTGVEGVPADVVYNNLVGVPSGKPWTATNWVRANAGTSTAQDFIGGGGPGAAAAGLSTTTTWARNEMYDSNHAGTDITLYIADGRDLQAYGGIAGGTRRQVFWGMQLEQADFASSYIRSADNASAGPVRAADILSGPIATVQVAMINGTFAFEVAPIFSSARGIADGSDQCIFSFAEDDSERIFFVVSGGSIYIRVTSGGATKVTSSALTFSAHQKLSIGINATAGSITVGGATTGNGTVTGTPWTRTTGPTMYVGSRQGGTQPLYARIGPVTPSQSSAKIVLFMLGESNMQGNSITAKILGRVQDYYPNAKKVECCIGGTTLYSDWAKAGGAAYASALAAWNAAIAEDPDLLNCTPIIIWGQGETDSYSAGWTAAYGTNLPALFVNIETDRPFFAGCKKIIHMLYPQCGLDPTAPAYTQAATIRSAESAYQAANPTLVATTETSDLTTYDTVHYDDASTTTIAQRDAAIVRGWIG